MSGLAEELPTLKLPKASCDQLNRLRHDLNEQEAVPVHSHDYLIHPLQFIRTLRSLIDDNVTVTCDVGSHYIWMARYFRSYEPRRLLFSNGMQTLGVALPWGLLPHSSTPVKKSFLFLETEDFCFHPWSSKPLYVLTLR